MGNLVGTVDSPHLNWRDCGTSNLGGDAPLRQADTIDCHRRAKNNHSTSTTAASPDINASDNFVFAGRSYQETKVTVADQSTRDSSHRWGQQSSAWRYYARRWKCSIYKPARWNHGGNN